MKYRRDRFDVVDRAVDVSLKDEPIQTPSNVSRKSRSPRSVHLINLYPGHGRGDIGSLGIPTVNGEGRGVTL